MHFSSSPSFFHLHHSHTQWNVRLTGTAHTRRIAWAEPAPMTISSAKTITNASITRPAIRASTCVRPRTATVSAIRTVTTGSSATFTTNVLKDMIPQSPMSIRAKKIQTVKPAISVTKMSVSKMTRWTSGSCCSAGCFSPKMTYFFI